MCGAEFIVGNGLPLGHLFENGYTVIEQPTEESEGIYEGYCSRCGEVVRGIIYYVPGDVNGDGILSVKDLTAMKKVIAGGDVEAVMANCDVNGDGLTNMTDLRDLKRLLAGA